MGSSSDDRDCPFCGGDDDRYSDKYCCATAARNWFEFKRKSHSGSVEHYDQRLRDLEAGLDNMQKDRR
jgi:hypothetical protein